MQRHDDDAIVAAELQMASTLRDMLETDASEGPRRLHSGDDGEPRAHAAISTLSICGRSRPLGRGSLSK